MHMQLGLAIFLREADLINISAHGKRSEGECACLFVVHEIDAWHAFRNLKGLALINRPNIQIELIELNAYGDLLSYQVPGREQRRAVRSWRRCSS